MSYEDLRSILDSNVKRSVASRIFDLGVDTSFDAKQENERLNIIVEHSQMKKVLPMAVNLEQAKHHMAKAITCLK